MEAERAKQLLEMAEERERLKAEQAESQKMMAELFAMKALLVEKEGGGEPKPTIEEPAPAEGDACTMV